MFVMLLPSTHSIDRNYEAIEINVNHFFKSKDEHR